MSNVDWAKDLAQKAHAGQVDKAGRPYFEHLEAVASSVEYDDEKVVAYLHDIVEDTDYDLKDLFHLGCEKYILEAIDCMTKKKGQDYHEYLVQVKSNSLARVVKLADLRHNSNLNRLPKIYPKDLERYEKYQKAIAFLEEK